MGGDSTSSRLTPSDTGVVLSTRFVSDLTNGSGATKQYLDTTGITGGGRDTDFETIAARRTYDASILEVDFIPDNAQMSLQFTFASEEYSEFVGSIFNDQVGIWINGTKVTSPVFTLASINSFFVTTQTARSTSTMPAAPIIPKWMGSPPRFA